MILRMYSVYDKAVGAFMTPIFFRSENEAVRALKVIGSDHSFRQSPGDYALYALGEFDDASGHFAPMRSVEGDVVPPQKVAELSALVGE